MKTVTEKKANNSKPDIRKVATRKATGFVSIEDFRKSAGIWEGRNVTLEEIREKSWGKK